MIDLFVVISESTQETEEVRDSTAADWEDVSPLIPHSRSNSNRTRLVLADDVRVEAKINVGIEQNRGYGCDNTNKES